MRKKLLWVGDAAVPSGFAVATHAILEVLRQYYDVYVLGINYRGDPHEHPYPIWAAAPGGDFLGVGRLVWTCDVVKPDIIVLQNDPWNIPAYMAQIRRFKEYNDVVLVGAVAVDGKALDFQKLNGLDLAIFWTQFGLDEAREGGYNGPGTVIPLGVDSLTFYPEDKKAAKNKRLPQMADRFIVGNVNRNQSRKRLDLTIQYFCEWVSAYRIKDASLYLHVAPTGDTGVNVIRLMRYYGQLQRLALVAPETWYGIPPDDMRQTYNCFDVQVTTSIGEGFGLTTFEGGACQVPQILPKHSALAEYYRDAAWFVKCSSTECLDPYSAIGQVPDKEPFIAALHAMYQNEKYRVTNGQAAFERATETRFTWTHVGGRYVEALAPLIDHHIQIVRSEEMKEAAKQKETVQA